MSRILTVAACILITLIFNRASHADDSGPAATTCYDVRVETIMPHLEENLRYATTEERHCVTRHDLHALFPILHHPALGGCRLGPEAQLGDGSWQSELACVPDHGTRGTANWTVAAYGESGELVVRLGGKNMTFSQRITARARPSADSAQPPR